MNRPLVWVAVGLLCGTWLAESGFLWGWVFPVLLGVAAVIFPRIAPARRLVAPLAMGLLFIALGALVWNVRHREPPGDPLSRFALTLPEDTRYTLSGVVRRPDIFLPDGDYMQFWLRVESIEFNGKTRELTGGVIVRWTDPAMPLHTGERLEITGPLDHDLSHINPDTRSAEDSLRRHGIHTALRLYGPASLNRLDGSPGLSPIYWISRFRSTLAHRLQRVIPEKTLPFILTVWLGDRRRIDNETYSQFLHSGTAHILAVSGVHTGIVFLTIQGLFRLLFGIRYRRACALATMIAVLAFAIMAGARIPSLRAAMMLILYLTADLFDRESDAPTALSIAGILFIGYDPDSLFDVSFQLSFLSIASILLFGKPIAARLTRFPGRLSEGLGSTLAVQAIPLPVAVGLAGVLPVVAPLINLVIIPLLALVLWLSFATSVCAVFIPPLAVLFGHALTPPVWLIYRLTDLVSAIPGAFLNLSTPTSLGAAAYWASMLCLAILVYRMTDRRNVAVAAAVLFVVAVVLWTPFRKEAQIVFLDVGHGDATFIRTPGGSAILVDGGNKNGFVDMGGRVILPFLRANHVSHLDAVFVTHDDADHIGGIESIIDRIPVSVVYMNPHRAESGLGDRLMRQCRAKRIPVRTLTKGDILTSAGAKIEVLHPLDEALNSDNDNSLVLRVSWPGMTVLLTGDIEAGAEKRLRAEYGEAENCEADILKVPHHGSQTSSTEEFIDAVRPTVAIVTVGRRQGGKIVRDFILERYGDREIRMYRTDYHGGIRCTVENGGVNVSAARTLRGYLHR